VIDVTRDGGGVRPLGVTIAGWGLIADAAISLVVIAITSVTAEIDPVAKVIGFAIFAAIAVLEIWIGSGILHRRRWLLGVAFPAFFLALGVLLPPLPGEPAPPLLSAVYSWIAMALWAFVCVALVWHRPWFTTDEEPIGARVQRGSER
jgi:hypothetical protein